jgi:hypothetical protein
MSAVVPLYSPERYRNEKEVGIRGANGAKLLKKLTGRHYSVINYHLAGEKASTIAKAMKITEVQVSIILNDPLARVVIEQRFVDMDMELRGLMPKAIDALRTGLESPDTNVQLSAADKYFRTQGLYAPKREESAHLSAEDLVRQLLDQTKTGETTSVSLTVRKEI